MLDKLKDFRDALSERIKSPFVGSFIISWSIIHWKILATLFYNEDKITIQQRIDKIDNYLSTETFFTLIVCPILITLAVIFTYNVLNAVGLFIKLLYDNWASPYIQKFLYNKNIIEKSKYEKIKQEYSTIKKDYDEDRDKFINSEKERRELKNNFENFQNSAFEGQLLNDITQAFNQNIQWENSYIPLNGTRGRETFNCDKDGFVLTDGRKIKVENIKITPNGKILAFDKVIDGKILHNFLIRDNNGNYHGVENENVIIAYRKKTDDKIIIHSAHYRREKNFIDVTEKIRDLVANGTTEITATNDLMGGEPFWGQQKSLVIDYTISGQKKNLTILEGATHKLD